MLNVLSVFVVYIGLAGFIGWIANIPVLYRVMDSWVTMKPITAAAVLFVGVGLLARRRRRVLDAIELALYTIVFLMIFASFFGASATMAAADDPLMSSGPGVPSLATMVCSIMCATGFAVRKPWPWHVVGVVASVPVVGYLLWFVGIDAPWLFWYFRDWSSAMAFPTAVAFLVAGGVGVKMLGQRHADAESPELAAS